MSRYVDFLIQLMQFAGVAVAAIAVLVAVVRTGLASLAGERSRQMTTISLDLARTVLIGLDLLLVSAALEAAIYAREPDFVRLGTVAGLRIALTLLVSFELAFRADGDPGRRASAAGRPAVGDGPPATVPQPVHPPGGRAPVVLAGPSPARPGRHPGGGRRPAGRERLGRPGPAGPGLTGSPD